MSDTEDRDSEDRAIQDYVREALPHGWFEDVEISVDREEILVVGRLKPVGDEADEHAIARFREESRSRRMEIARGAERRFNRAVSWGAQCGPTRRLFTTISVPAMTRLRQQERAVLDTLIDAGVARSRSEALAWCVRLVGANEEAWLSSLRDAFQAVKLVRNRGPAGNSPGD